MFKTGVVGMAGMAMESRVPAVWAFQSCHTSAIPLNQGVAGMAMEFVTIAIAHKKARVSRVTWLLILRWVKVQAPEVLQQRP
jgi:hypothetical protein